MGREAPLGSQRPFDGATEYALARVVAVEEAVPGKSALHRIPREEWYWATHTDDRYS
jgi:hypothetical protein